MICSICKKGETSVVDSRPAEDGTVIRRRRQCICGGRFTTFERVQFRELIIVKKNGRKSSFDRDKLSKSIYIALKKRPLDTETIEKFITKISRSLEEMGQNENFIFNNWNDGYGRIKGIRSSCICKICFCI
tara:strand:- start:28 stop:420 length:393 start_codon:yes stop_codon:yes gene_type:complete